MNNNGNKEILVKIPFVDIDHSIKSTITGGSYNKFEKDFLYITSQNGFIYKIDLISNDYVPYEFKSINNDLHIEEFANHSNLIDGIPSLPKNFSFDERGLLTMIFHPTISGIYFIVYSRAITQFDINLLGDDYFWFGKSMSRKDESKKNEMDHISVLAVIDTNNNQIGVLWEIPQPQFNHNGGGLIFDVNNPNYLYWGLGDGGGMNDMHGKLTEDNIHIGFAQDLTKVYGKLWRINLNDKTLYERKSKFLKPKSIKMIAYGLRNPWRIVFDPNDSDSLVISDVGQDNWESIKIVPLSKKFTEPHNMGWNFFEGTHDFNIKLLDYYNIKKEDIIKPVIEYERNGIDTYAIIGGFFNKEGNKFIFGDYSGMIFESDWPPSNLKPNILTDKYVKQNLKLHSMVQDFYKNIYGLFVDFRNNHNLVIKIYENKNGFNISWKSSIAIQRHKDIAGALGRPDWFSPEPGGNAGWNEATLKRYGLIFYEIRIVDEAIPHPEPALHCDCMYISIKVKIPMRFLEKINYISKSMWYDQLKESLVARCHFVGASVATLRLALETIDTDFVIIAFPDLYKKYIMEASTPKGLIKQYKRLVTLLNTTRKNYPVTSKTEKICDYNTFEVNSLDELPSLKNISGLLFVDFKDNDDNINTHNNNDKGVVLPSIIVYVPHVCLLMQFFDPSCDYRSKGLGLEISKGIPHSVFISSRTLRAVCDNNRKKCRGTSSRKRLREYMIGDFTVIEVHTFGGNISHWKLKSLTKIEAVILMTPSGERWGTTVYSTLKQKGIIIEKIKGDPLVNDVQLEVYERGGKGILLELNENLSRERAKRIGEIISALNNDKFNINAHDNNNKNLPSITNNLAGLFEFIGFLDLLNSDIKIIIDQAKNAIKNTKSGTRVDSNGNPVNPVMQIVILPKGYPDKTLKKYKFYDVGARNDDNAWNISKDIAKAKAYTALGSSSNENASSSKSFHIPSEPGQSLYGIGNSNRNEKKGIITFAGGIPLYKKGKLIGAIGVSGDMVNIDEIIAKAAVKGFEAPEVIRADNVLNIEY